MISRGNWPLIKKRRSTTISTKQILKLKKEFTKTTKRQPKQWEEEVILSSSCKHLSWISNSSTMNSSSTNKTKQIFWAMVQAATSILRCQVLVKAASRKNLVPRYERKNQSTTVKVTKVKTAHRSKSLKFFKLTQLVEV